MERPATPESRKAASLLRHHRFFSSSHSPAHFYGYESLKNELEVAAIVSLPSYRLKSPFDRLLQVIQRFCPV
jgi:hypothetical protein